MNRDIKFRVFYKGVMIYDVTVATSPLHIWIYDEKIPKDVPDDFYDGLIEGKAGYWILGGFELMQYTNFNDRKGKDVYEGDVYRIDWEDGPYIDTVEMISFWRNIRNSELRRLEVVGNIYENPELLEE